MHGCLRVVALAIHLAKNGCRYWLTHDLKDAFCNIPVPRLLNVVSSWLPCPTLEKFLSLILPPRSRSLHGVKQGGAVSSLALEVYLTHFLHRPWRERFPDRPLIRYADDLLVP